MTLKLIGDLVRKVKNFDDNDDFKDTCHLIIGGPCFQQIAKNMTSSDQNCDFCKYLGKFYKNGKSSKQRLSQRLSIIIVEDEKSLHGRCEFLSNASLASVNSDIKSISINDELNEIILPEMEEESIISGISKQRLVVYGDYRHRVHIVKRPLTAIQFRLIASAVAKSVEDTLPESYLYFFNIDNPNQSYNNLLSRYRRTLSATENDDDDDDQIVNEIDNQHVDEDEGESNENENDRNMKKSNKHHRTDIIQIKANEAVNEIEGNEEKKILNQQQKQVQREKKILNDVLDVINDKKISSNTLSTTNSTTTVVSKALITKPVLSKFNILFCGDSVADRLYMHFQGVQSNILACNDVSLTESSYWPKLQSIQIPKALIVPTIDHRNVLEQIVTNEEYRKRWKLKIKSNIVFLHAADFFRHIFEKFTRSDFIINFANFQNDPDVKYRIQTLITFLEWLDSIGSIKYLYLFTPTLDNIEFKNVGATNGIIDSDSLAQFPHKLFTALFNRIILNRKRYSDVGLNENVNSNANANPNPNPNEDSDEKEKFGSMQVRFFNLAYWICPKPVMQNYKFVCPSEAWGYNPILSDGVHPCTAAGEFVGIKALNFLLMDQGFISSNENFDTVFATKCG